MAKKEADTINAKRTLGKVETTIKTAVESETKRLLKEEQQEKDAKTALQQRMREAQDKNTPGAVSDAEQQKDEVASIPSCARVGFGGMQRRPKVEERHIKELDF